MDNDGSIGGMYQLYSTPTTYFIDPNGVVQDNLVGVVGFDWLARNFERSTQ